MKTTAQQTPVNLQAAFAGESMANRKYLYFAKVARQKGDEATAKLFERTAEEETAHAFGHLALLYPPETLKVEDLLRIALEGELHETNHMYPEFERVARAEQDDAAVAEFKEQGEESAGHAAMFKDALAKAERVFRGLAKVEAAHAKRYEDALGELRGSSGPRRPVPREAGAAAEKNAAE